MRIRKAGLDTCCGWILTVLLTALIGFGQQQSQADLTDSLKRLRAGEVYPADTHRLAEAGAVEAIPSLQEQFSLQEKPLLKAAIASALVRLGEQNLVYRDFLLSQAKAAVDNDAPSIFLLDSNGRIVRGHGRLPPDFIAWAEANNLDPKAAAQAQVYELPMYVTLLGITGDDRGKDLLKKGLKSRNHLIQVNAARGLAKLGDRDSIPLIISACKNTPAQEMAGLIARALVFFDDVQAQSAADSFISDKQLLSRLRQQARDKRADPFSP